MGTGMVTQPVGWDQGIGAALVRAGAGVGAGVGGGGGTYWTYTLAGEAAASWRISLWLEAVSRPVMGSIACGAMEIGAGRPSMALPRVRVPAALTSNTVTITARSTCRKDEPARGIYGHRNGGGLRPRLPQADCQPDVTCACLWCGSRHRPVDAEGRPLIR